MHIAAVARRLANDRPVALRESSDSGQFACRRLQRHPSSFIVAFIAVVFAFAYAEFVPKTYVPFGSGQFTFASSTVQPGRSGPSSFAAAGSPTSSLDPFATGRPCLPFNPQAFDLPYQAVATFASVAYLLAVVVDPVPCFAVLDSNQPSPFPQRAVNPPDWRRVRAQLLEAGPSVAAVDLHRPY